MKKLISVLAILLLIGCTKEGVAGCNCQKDYYQRTFNGPTFIYLYSEPALCQEPSDGYQSTADNFINFKISCD